MIVAWNETAAGWLLHSVVAAVHCATPSISAPQGITRVLLLKPIGCRPVDHLSSATLPTVWARAGFQQIRTGLYIARVNTQLANIDAIV